MTSGWESKGLGVVTGPYINHCSWVDKKNPQKMLPDQVIATVMILFGRHVQKTVMGTSWEIFVILMKTSRIGNYYFVQKFRDIHY